MTAIQGSFESLINDEVSNGAETVMIGLRKLLRGLRKLEGQLRVQKTVKILQKMPGKLEGQPRGQQSVKILQKMPGKGKKSLKDV